jgi:hypothetical protein
MEHGMDGVGEKKYLFKTPPQKKKKKKTFEPMKQNMKKFTINENHSRVQTYK